MAEETADEQPSKRLRHEEPDLTVIVGDTEFQCYSQVLRYASDYIDTMLSSNMQEGASKVIRFPDKDPEGWKIFYPFLEPRTVASLSGDVKITEFNVKVLVPWFHEFGMDSMLMECDKVLYNNIGKKFKDCVDNIMTSWAENVNSEVPMRLRMGKVLWDTLIEIGLEFCRLYQLLLSGEVFSQALKTILTDVLDWSEPFFIYYVLPKLLNDDSYRKLIWPCLERYIPEALRDEAPEDLVEERCFVYMLAAEEKSQNSGCYRGQFPTENSPTIVLSSPPGSTNLNGILVAHRPADT